MKKGIYTSVLMEFIFSRKSLDLVGLLLKHFGGFVINCKGKFNFSGFQRNSTLKSYFHLLNELKIAHYLKLGKP